MAQDVWLLRKALITCILLSVLAGNASAASENRKQALDSYFAHPEILKENNKEEKSFGKTRKFSVSASSLSKLHSGKEKSTMRSIQNLDQEVSSKLSERLRKSLEINQERHSNEEGIDLNRFFTQAKKSDIELNKYGKNSMEGRNIMKAASLVESYLESQGTGLNEPVKFSEEKRGNRLLAFQYFLPIHNTGQLEKHSRFSYVNSLLRPQLTGIQADLYALEAQRNRLKSVNSKASKKGLKFVGSSAERKALPVGIDFKSKADKQELKEADTGWKTEPPYFSADEDFIFDSPDGSSDAQESFFSNLQPTLLFSGSGGDTFVQSENKTSVAVSAHSPKHSTALILNPSIASEIAIEKFQQSGFEDSTHTWKETDLDENGEDLSGELTANPPLVSRTGKKLKKTTEVSPQSLKQKTMSHIQAESQNLNKKQSGSEQGIFDIKRVSPYMSLRSAKVRGFPKITLPLNYKRTSIPSHSQWVSSGSGEGSGSGGSYLTHSRHHLQWKPSQRVSTKGSSATRKTHTAITGAKDTETRNKCTKMGKSGVKTMSILALGDSLTNGFHSDDKSHTPYAKTLEYLLNKDEHTCYIMETVAKDGAEAYEMSASLQKHLKNRKVKYQWVIILAGTNDIVHNGHTHRRRAWDTALEHIIDLHITSHRFGAKTMVVTIPEMDCEESDRPPCKNTRLERNYINEKLRHYAKTNDFTTLCDLAKKFPRYSLTNKERKRLWEEGLHLRPAGYEKMAEIIYKDLLANIDKVVK
ncbi:uncharacterized protein [Montipora capricornis]|uniref:uncharacterized protein n=1 Tax=Montipora capricornis TaxID=246305 RepID=UPI0035F12037